eukprot:111251_1
MDEHDRKRKYNNHNRYQTHNRPATERNNVETFILSGKQSVEAMFPDQTLLTFGYIRENASEDNIAKKADMDIPTVIIHYIAIFAFYPLYEYRSDFDTNGIVYAIATHHGHKQWQNPAKQGLIRIKSSGWVRDNIEGVLARTIKGNGHYHSFNTMHSWLCIDFGANKKVRASRYTLRHGGTRGLYLRDWNLEGSNDGTNWCALIQHENDTHLNSEYCTHTWAISVCEYYQMFRIFMTGENSMGYWYLSCSGFEMYGHLTHV